MNCSKICCIAVLLLGCVTVSAYAEGRSFRDLATVPPMGWNSWNYFAGGINEQVILEMADAMVASGMKDAGYQYVVIDDSWQIGRVDRTTRETTVNGLNIIAIDHLRVIPLNK